MTDNHKMFIYRAQNNKFSVIHVKYNLTCQHLIKDDLIY